MQVFLSYARSANRVHARAVFEELGGDTDPLAFLDTEQIEHLDEFPQRLIDGLFDSRVVVIFADPTYFTRWYCRMEFRATLAPFNYLTGRTGSTPEERKQALESIVIVLPVAEVNVDLWNLPPKLHPTHWCTADQPQAVATIARTLLSRSFPTLGERIERTVGIDRFRREWLQTTQLPAAEQIPVGVPFAPLRGVPRSLQQGFIGRADDLWRIHNALTSPAGPSATSAFMTVAVEGSGGVGKSQLAVEYLYRFGTQHFPGGLFWIDAERELDAQYYQIAKALNPATPNWTAVQSEPGGIADRLVQEFRSLPFDRPALVIIDDVPETDYDATPEPLESWFPVAGWVATLITSRTKISSSEEGGILPVPIDVLDPDDALILLTRNVEIAALTELEWRAITEWVGRLPLALVLLNRVLLLRALSASALVERMQESGTTELLDRAMKSIKLVVRQGALRGATEALMISYERLPDAAKLAARLLAWLAPAPIPDAIVEALGERLSSETRAVLAARSIVTETRGAEVPMYGAIHRVLGDFLREQTEQVGEELTGVTQAVVDVMTKARVDAPAMWPLMDACVPHAHALMRYVSMQQPRETFVGHAAALALPLVALALNQGRGAVASDLALGTLPLLSVPDQEGGFTVVTDHPSVHSFIDIVPTALAQGGQLDGAIDMQRIRISFLDQAASPDQAELLTQRDNLAMWLRERRQVGDLDEAASIYEETIPRWRAIEPHGRNILVALNNMALVEGNRGNTGAAIARLEDVLKQLGFLQNMEIDTITTQRSLAELVTECDPERADALFRQALTTADRIKLPDQHPLKLPMLYRVAVSARQRKDYADARPLFTRMLTALLASKGARDSGTTVAAWLLFEAQMHLGEPADAAATRTIHLDWLIEATPDDLTPDQRRIRDSLLHMAETQ